MNRGQIRTLTRKKLGEVSGAFWSDDELNAWINYGCKDIAFRTKCLRDNGYYQTADCSQNTNNSKSNEIAISSYFTNLLSIDQVYFHKEGTEWYKLKPTSRTELDILHEGWRDLVGYTKTNGIQGPWDVSTNYGVGALVTYDGSTWESLVADNLGNTPAEGANWTASSLEIQYNYDSDPSQPTHYYYEREEDLFGVYPPSDSDNSTTNNVRVYYRKNHADMSLDADTPTIPQPMHLAIVEFVVATGLESRGWQERANNSWEIYFKQLNDYKIERHREREDDDIIMKNYRNI